MLFMYKDVLTLLCLCVNFNLHCEAEVEILEVESLQFNLASIRNATDNFSDSNKLGQGGFGAVYKVTKEKKILNSNHYIFLGFILSVSNIIVCWDILYFRVHFPMDKI